MEYTVIKIGGKQHQVKIGEELTVDKLSQKEGETIELGEVLLQVKEGKTLIGQPLVKNAKVLARVISHLKGKKIRVAKFRAKARYRRVCGFRPQLTKIKIEKIASS